MSLGLQTTQEEKDFCPPWFDEYKFQGFQLRHIETRSAHLLDLKMSIKKRYDPDQPIIVARSKDPDANGYIIDGRNRLICCNEIQKETGILPNITTTFENVASLAHAKLRQAYYESQHVTKKSAQTAKEHIRTLISEVQELAPQLFKNRTLDEVLKVDGKFDDVVKMQAVIDDLEKQTQKRKAEDKRLREKISSAASEKQAKWKRDHKENESKATTDNVVATYASEVTIVCEHGKKSTYPCNINLTEKGTATIEVIA